MLKKLLVVAAVALPQVALAGAANFSVTSITGTGSSIDFSSSVDTYAESATGNRHLMTTGTGTDYSHRHEFYSRASASVNTDASVTTTDMTISGTVINATRIGESDIHIETVSHTDGFTTNSSAYVEVGVFYADESVGDSYSYESGTYAAAGTEYGFGFYATDVSTITDAQSSYGIYGSN